MIELKIDRFENGRVTFHISHQDKEDYERLRQIKSYVLSNGLRFNIWSVSYPEYSSGYNLLCVRGGFDKEDDVRLDAFLGEYLLIFELIKKYNEDNHK